MKWEKLGKIFDPTDHLLANNCAAFSQSPQSLVLHDRIRVFFSTRERDSVGKYLSHVAFVDFDRNMKTVLGISDNAVLPLGGLGSFDEHGIFPFHVLREEGRVLAFTTGWNRKVSVSVDAAIGLAISQDDGQTFKRHGTGPIMGPALHEPFLIGDAFVARYGGLYHMWYIFGIKWKQLAKSEPADRVYKIAHATSSNAIDWDRNGTPIITDRLNADECQALPTVFHLGNRYHMYFCFRQAHGFRDHTNHAYRIGYAYSTDLVTWIRNDEAAGIDVSETGWDSQMQCYPHTFEIDKKIYMLYNGNKFGKHGFGLAVLVES